jgi:hypothetical protein
MSIVIIITKIIIVEIWLGKMFLVAVANGIFAVNSIKTVLVRSSVSVNT